jgi:hypothetical protein
MGAWPQLLEELPVRYSLAIEGAEQRSTPRREISAGHAGHVPHRINCWDILHGLERTRGAVRRSKEGFTFAGELIWIRREAEEGRTIVRLVVRAKNLQ